MKTSIASALLLAAIAAACGGAEDSSLLDGQDSSTATDAQGAVDSNPISDATPPLDGSSSVDSAAPKDAAFVDVVVPKDAGNPYQDPGIACGNSECTPGTQLCCITVTYYPQMMNVYTCAQSGNVTSCTGGTPINCDDDKDCPNNGICCGDLNEYTKTYQQLTCKQTCTGVINNTYEQVHFCDPMASDCPNGTSCKPSGILTGYYNCQ